MLHIAMIGGGYIGVEMAENLVEAGLKVAIVELADHLIAPLDFDMAADALEVFVDKFRKLWFRENKPHGFDVQELRLGGLLLRLRSQKARLVAYRNGEVDKIDELCEELLEYIGQGNAKKIDRLPVLNSYTKNVSPNVI